MSGPRHACVCVCVCVCVCGVHGSTGQHGSIRRVQSHRARERLNAGPVRVWTPIVHPPAQTHDEAAQLLTLTLNPKLHTRMMLELSFKVYG